MPRSGPFNIYKVSGEFTLTAARMVHAYGMQAQAVTALGLHPLRLSQWRNNTRARTLRGWMPKVTSPDLGRQIARLQEEHRAI